ncbi:lipopolysaccharide-induced tumor necrosis factor-alpha factor homolog [Drosophila biarmipes]|uniref:lipopolysaccharide-induced tumor necrosis factor-alpha factor homolog n=1 Tax=Drosophila biarmipes TaxID=125945 RepID=UPI0007E795B1|nr:lipopolysaccharide-induced tumor necrosis factor-alpha factor homolog [Drosophila biarmipes]
MAEEKHRMLYQGQDASQVTHQKQRPMSLSPSEPPTYDDAMNEAMSSALANFGYSADRRRTFFAEPQHLRNGLEGMPQVVDEDGDSPPLQQGPPPPPVRDFFTSTPQPKLGNKPVEMVCPACGQRALTRLRRSPNASTHIWSLWMCAFGWCCCACLCPYLWNCCRTTNHYCSSCEIFLGAHYPAGCCCCRL